MTARTNLEKLLDVLAEKLLERIENGEATAADFNVARQFLKDNKIDALPTEESPLGKLANALPFKSREEIAEEEQFH